MRHIYTTYKVRERKGLNIEVPIFIFIIIAINLILETTKKYCLFQ